jgi:argininosuccinate lyase
MSILRGRFSGSAGADMQSFASSLELDLLIFEQDIDGSLAHARMLGQCGIVSQSESEELVTGLEQIRRDFKQGRWIPDDSQEDIHMAIESRLIEQLGPVGAKLHTARSRNDQVATDVKLWLKQQLTELDTALVSLISTLCQRVRDDGKTLMPGYTHLQRGQPIWLGHQLLAHTWALTRDRERLEGALSRCDRSPLGACAMAGTPHPIDRQATAANLGFATVQANAMDAVACRDHQQEVAALCAILAGHLSRMAEELVLWSTVEFGLVRVSEDYTTGSSIMPQKRNPDAAELIRGKSSRVHGDLQALLSLTRALPLSYNRDLQEDRQPLFDAVHTTLQCCRIMQAMWQGLTINSDRFVEDLKGDFSLATEIADHLASQGMPFREAHSVVGALVQHCEDRGIGLDAISQSDAASIHRALDFDLGPLLDPVNAIEKRTSEGGTAYAELEKQLDSIEAGLN